MLDDTSGSILDRLTAEYHLDDRKRAILTAFLKLSLRIRTPSCVMWMVSFRSLMLSPPLPTRR